MKKFIGLLKSGIFVPQEDRKEFRESNYRINNAAFFLAALIVLVYVVVSFFTARAELADVKSFNAVWPVLTFMVVLTAVGAILAFLTRKHPSKQKYNNIFDLVYFFAAGALAAFIYYFMFVKAGNDKPDAMLLVLVFIVLFTRFDIRLTFGLLTAQFAMFLTVLLLAKHSPVGMMLDYVLCVFGAFAIWTMRVKSFVSEKKFIKLANSDFLTNVHNRRGFNMIMEAAWADAVRTGGKLTVYMIDIDHFKRYNDTYGHVEGDNCLKVVSSAIVEAMRKGDTVARYGCEEFIVLIKNTSKADEKRIGNRIMARLASKALKHEHSVTPYVSVSIGCANYKPTVESEITLTDLIRMADDALYYAKENGRNRIVYYEDM